MLLHEENKEALQQASQFPVTDFGFECAVKRVANGILAWNLWDKMASKEQKWVKQ